MSPIQTPKLEVGLPGLGCWPSIPVIVPSTALDLSCCSSKDASNSITSALRFRSVCFFLGQERDLVGSCPPAVVMVFAVPEPPAEEERRMRGGTTSEEGPVCEQQASSASASRIIWFSASEPESESSHVSTAVSRRSFNCKEKR